MDDGGPRPGDIFDVDGTDDDAEVRARPAMLGGGIKGSCPQVAERAGAGCAPPLLCLYASAPPGLPSCTPSPQLVPKSWVINLICGPGVMQTVDDVRGCRVQRGTAAGWMREGCSGGGC